MAAQSSTDSGKPLKNQSIQGLVRDIFSAANFERLKGGRKFVTGKRKEFYAGSFDTGSSIQLLAQNGGELITTRSGALHVVHDELEGVPLF